MCGDIGKENHLFENNLGWNEPVNVHQQIILLRYNGVSYVHFTNAEHEQKKVEDETRLEDDLEMHLIDAKKELLNSREAVTVACWERVDNTVVQAEKLTDEIHTAWSKYETLVEESGGISSQKSHKHKAT